MVAHIFDQNLIRLRQKRAAKKISDHDFLVQWAEKQIDERLSDIKRNLKDVLRIDPFHQAEFEGNKLDINEEFFSFPENSFDAIVNILNLHTVNDLPGALLQMKRALRPDGLFMSAMFGGETLYELRDCLSQAEIELKGGLSPRVFPFATKQDMGALLQRAGFALPVVDSEILTVSYSHVFKLLHDLRGMGQSNVIASRDKKYPGRALFLRAAEIYAQKYAEADGRITASFEVLFLIGWAPHDSQQKALKPGSAKTRLADYLGTEEIKT